MNIRAWGTVAGLCDEQFIDAPRSLCTEMQLRSITLCGYLYVATASTSDRNEDELLRAKLQTSSTPLIIDACDAVVDTSAYAGSTQNKTKKLLTQRRNMDRTHHSYHTSFA